MHFVDGYIEIDVSSYGDCLDVAVEGELDVASVSLMDRVAADVAGRAARRVTIGAEGLRFVDLMGLRSLARLAESAACSGAVVRLTGLSPLARRVVRVAGLRSLERICAPPPPPLLPSVLAA